MADKTPIEWADATINCINGCSLQSPGCANCYAMKQAHRVAIRRGLTMPSKGGMVWTGEVRFAEDQLLKPLAWKRPRRIFWNAHGDTFHNAVPDEWIDRVFAVCALTPQHTHMILTKRSARMRAYLTRLRARWDDAGDPFDDRIGTLLVELSGSPCAIGMWEEEFILPNVWLGVSVEDQTRADERIPDLLATPAAKRFISAEPLLGPIDLTRIMEAGAEECFHHVEREPFHFEGRTWTEGRASLNALTGHYWGEDLIDGRWEGWVDYHQSPGFGEPGYYKPLDLVIAGGENGPRPMHPDWPRSLRDQCAPARVPFFFKQWGSCLPGNMDGEDENGGPAYEIEDVAQPVDYDQLGRGRLIQAHGCDFIRFPHHRTGRLLDGIEHNGVPA